MTGIPRALRPTPDPQTQEYQLLVCKRLGANPEEVLAGGFRAQILSDDDPGEVTLTFYVPSRELRELYNQAGENVAARARDKAAVRRGAAVQHLGADPYGLAQNA